ncbi:amidase domain-containing protein [Caldicellulosiruptor saccharolyticus]|uniref:amidase domain-containing protein n=1 Tax=Caldicellulosiruptor saccharolyticus TaxID=44001 RepID=UPI00030314FB|nr:amidase domain-containing protein [Caldicellulosiruptor saccharolyticus]
MICNRYLSNSARGTILGRWKYGGQIGFNDYNDVLQPGDILFYDWNSDGRFDHAGVSVG